MNEVKNNQPQHQYNDEIDLREVFAAIKRFFVGIGNSIVLFLLAVKNVTKRYWLLLVAFVIIGGVAGYLSYKAFRNYYTSTMTITSEYYKGELLLNLVGELKDLASEGNAVRLSKKINVPEEVAAQVRSIEIEPLVDPEYELAVAADLAFLKKKLAELPEANNVDEEQLEAIEEKLMLNTDTYVVKVKVYSNEVLPELEEGILYYLNNNPYIQKIRKVKKENLQALQNKLQKEQHSLDNLKEAIAKNYANSGEAGGAAGSVVIGPKGSFGPVQVFEEDIRMFKEALAVNQDLALKENIEVVNGFTPFNKPASASLVESILYAVLISLGIAYLIILLLEINKALVRFEQKRKMQKQ